MERRKSFCVNKFCYIIYFLGLAFAIALPIAAMADDHWYKQGDPAWKGGLRRMTNMGDHTYSKVAKEYKDCENNSDFFSDEHDDCHRLREQFENLDELGVGIIVFQAITLLLSVLQGLAVVFSIRFRSRCVFISTFVSCIGLQWGLGIGIFIMVLAFPITFNESDCKDMHTIFLKVCGETDVILLFVGTGLQVIMMSIYWIVTYVDYADKSGMAYIKPPPSSLDIVYPIAPLLSTPPF